LFLISDANHARTHPIKRVLEHSQNLEADLPKKWLDLRRCWSRGVRTAHWGLSIDTELKAVPCPFANLQLPNQVGPRGLVLRLSLGATPCHRLHRCTQFN
jgi:hypothetical protein